MPKPKVRVLRPGGLGFRNAFENGVRCLPVRHVRWIPLSMYPNPSSSQILKIVGDILILCPFYPSIPVYHHHPFVKSGEIAEITTFSVSQFVLVKSPCFNMCHSFCLVESPFFYEKIPMISPKRGNLHPLSHREGRDPFGGSVETGRHVRHLGMIHLATENAGVCRGMCGMISSTEVMDFIKKNGDLSNLSNKNGEILWQHKIMTNTSVARDYQ